MKSCSDCKSKTDAGPCPGGLSCKEVRAFQSEISEAREMLKYQVHRNKKLEFEIEALKKALIESQKQHRGYKGQLIKQTLERAEKEGAAPPKKRRKAGVPANRPLIPAPRKTTLF